MLEWYPWLRAAHLLGVFVWIGPLLGGWWMLARAERHPDPAVARWARRAFLPLTHIEHLGLLIWLATGITMATLIPGYLDDGWMHAKLGVLVCVVLPVELWDMAVSHGRLPGAFRRAGDGTTEELERALAAHTRLCTASAALLIPATILILCLATLRPGIH